MGDKKQVIKDTFKFTSARYISQGLGFFTAIAMRRFLGPFYMGMWSLLKVLLGYVAYLFMGVDQGALNKIPLYAGQGDEKAEGEVRNNLFGFMLLVSVAAAIVLFAAAVCLRHVYPREVIFGLYVLSAYVILENMCAFYQLLLRTKHNFSVLSKSIIFESAVNLILILLLVRNFKIYGLYIAIVLTALLNILFMRVLARYRIRFNLNMRRLFDLARTGFPITIVGLLQWALASLDRIMIAGMIGVTFVGYYSIPVMAKNYISQLSGFGTVLYPRLMEAYGKRQNVEDIKKYAIIPPMINAYILPVVLGIMFFVGPLLIKKILPQFSPGILAMQILLLSMFFESSRVQAFHFIVAMKKQVRVIPLVVGAIILNAVGNYMFIKKGYGIYGVAWATSIVTFLSFVVMQSYAMKHFARAREIFQFIVKIVFPLVYTVAAVLLLEKYIVIRNAYLEVIIKSCSLVFLSAPLFIYINKVTGIITLLYSILKDKIFEKFSGSIAFRDEEVRESGHGKYDIVFWAHSNNETDRYLPLLAGLKERGIKALLFYKQFKA
ncbi:MAG: oligosaccharide flippase family protein, partial [Candidatus Omnitrophota bacterium]